MHATTGLYEINIMITKAVYHLPDSPGDFSAVRQQMQLFLNCSKSLCVSIPIRDDTVLELEETFEVSVELGTTAARTNISLSRTNLQIAIVDNETGETR